MKLEMADIKSEDSVTSDEVDDSSTTTRSSYGANLSHAVVSLNFSLSLSLPPLSPTWNYYYQQLNLFEIMSLSWWHDDSFTEHSFMKYEYFGNSRLYHCSASGVIDKGIICKQHIETLAKKSGNISKRISLVIFVFIECVNNKHLPILIKFEFRMRSINQ